MKLGNTSKGRTPLTPLAAAIALALTAPLSFAEDEIAKDIDIDIEKIVVTGTFQQSLINRIPVTAKELPFTLDVIDKDFLDTRNFTRPIEVLTTLPNIARVEDRAGTGTTNFLSRGFAAPVLVDNRYQNDFRGMGARDDSFVERYEILKGPASIASGPVGAGGIINTVTKTPTANSAASIKMRSDQFGSAGVDFDINIGEIDNSDTMLLRVSGAYRDYKFDADHVSRKTTAIRPVAVFNLGLHTSIKASAAYRNVESNPNGGMPLTNEGELLPGVDTSTFNGFINGRSDSKDVTYDVEVNHEFLDDLKLTVRGSKQSTDNDYKHTGGVYGYQPPWVGGIDPDEEDNMIYVSENKARNTMEATFIDAQLAYQAEFWGQEQSFVIGVAHSENDWTREFGENYRWETISLEQIGQPIYGWDEENYGDLYLFTSRDQKLSSVFSEAALRPSENLTVIAGIRYDKLEQVNFRRGESFYDDNELTLRLGASYALSDELNAYASFAQAFVPQFGVKRDDSTAEAETSDGFEIGLKGSVFDNRTSFQTAYFSTKRKNVAVEDPANTTVYYVITAGEVDVQGVELSSTTILTDALNFSFNVGYTDIEVSDKDKELGVPNPVFPEITGSLYLNYEVLSGSLEGLSLSGGLRYVGESTNKTYKDKTWDGYTVADFSAKYPISDNISLSLGILNLTDELYIENTYTTGVNKYAYGAVLGAPRTVTMTLNWNM
ncbi:MAG: TonB-dependent siderophore receptor [Colwellia sp.]|nr:TonB-dependent siderophore receptor [Colwellia sp.]